MGQAARLPTPPSFAPAAGPDHTDGAVPALLLSLLGERVCLDPSGKG